MTFPLLSKELQSEFELRISKVRMAMQEQHIDALLIASTVNIYYLTGGVCRGYFYLPLDSDPIFFITPPAQINNPIAVSIRKPELIAGILLQRGYVVPSRVGLEFDDLYYSEIERYKKIFPEAEFKDAGKAMRAARLTKTERELEKMREDGLRQCAVYARVNKCYREDMTDLEFQAEIEHVLRLEGNLGYLRVAGSRMEINMGSVLAGPNAAAPSPYDFALGGAGVDPSLPVGASGVILRPGMSVMVDMNGGFNGYQTDMTRCWSVGDISEKALKAHECSREILRDLESFAVPGVEISEMWHRAKRIVDAYGLSKYFMGSKHQASFLGHGVGIELNEAPVIMERNHALLQENMTIALEPKFVIEGVGAVGVENTYVVKPEGLVNLTPFREEIQELLP